MTKGIWLRWTWYQNVTHYAERKVYVIFGSMGGIVLFVGIVAFVIGDYVDSAILFALLVFYLGGVFLWLTRYKLTISNDTLSYRSLFGGNRSLKYIDIETAEIRVGRYSYIDNYRPYCRLEIRPFVECRKKRIVINLAVFSVQAIRDARLFLGKKLQEE